MLAHIAGCASKHQIFVIVSFPTFQFTIEVLDVILGGSGKFLWVETVSAVSVKIFNKMRECFFSVSEFGHCRSRTFASLDPWNFHPIFIGRRYRSEKRRVGKECRYR